MVLILLPGPTFPKRVLPRHHRRGRTGPVGPYQEPQRHELEYKRSSELRSELEQSAISIDHATLAAPRCTSQPRQMTLATSQLP